MNAVDASFAQELIDDDPELGEDGAIREILELLSIPAYMLAGWRKRDLKSNEASLKDYLLGVRNKVSVFVNWAWNYFTRNRGARPAYAPAPPPPRLRPSAPTPRAARLPRRRLRCPPPLLRRRRPPHLLERSHG